MRRFYQLSFFSFFAATILLSGCKKDDEIEEETEPDPIALVGIYTNEQFNLMEVPDASEVSVATHLTLVFTGAVDAGSIQDIILFDDTSEILFTTEVRTDTVVVSPVEELDFSTTYTFEVSHVKFIQGATAETVIVSFTTAANVIVIPDPIFIESISSGGVSLLDNPEATDVSTEQDILVTFNLEVDPMTFNDISLKMDETVIPINATSSGNILAINPVDPLMEGTHFILLIAGVQSVDGAVSPSAEVGFTTAGIGLETVPNPGNQTMYLPLNGNAVDLTGNAVATTEQITYGTDRFGVVGKAAYFAGAQSGPGSGDIVELSGQQFLHPSTTISLWFKVDQSDYSGSGKFVFGICAERGYFLEFGSNLDWMKFPTSHKLDPDVNDYNFATAWADNINGSGMIGGNSIFNFEGSIANQVLTSNEWHQMIMTHEASTSVKSIYVDGQLISSWRQKAAIKSLLPKK